MSSETDPPVTVLMTVYNGMPYLPEAVESVFDQTFADWKFVIVNDGSTDDSKAYLDGLTDPRVEVIHQENRGLPAALNRGIQHTQSEYIARLDCDDVALPQRLEKQYAFMCRHPEVGLLGTQFQRLGLKRAGFPSKMPCDHEAIMDALLDGRHSMCHPTIMCRTQLLKEVGGYWETYISEDWDMYLKMGERSRLANLDEILLHYRVHNASLNGKRLAEIRLLQRYAAECSRRRQEKREAIDLAAFTEIEQGRPWSWHVRERLNERAMQWYRAGLANILGKHHWYGYLQLAAGAGCSPGLTIQRIQRMARFRRQVADNNRPGPPGASTVSGGSA